MKKIFLYTLILSIVFPANIYALRPNSAVNVFCEDAAMVSMSSVAQLDVLLNLYPRLSQASNVVVLHDRSSDLKKAKADTLVFDWDETISIIKKEWPALMTRYIALLWAAPKWMSPDMVWRLRRHINPTENDINDAARFVHLTTGVLTPVQYSTVLELKAFRNKDIGGIEAERFDLAMAGIFEKTQSSFSGSVWGKGMACYKRWKKMMDAEFRIKKIKDIKAIVSDTSLSKEEKDERIKKKYLVAGVYDFLEFAQRKNIKKYGLSGSGEDHVSYEAGLLVGISGFFDTIFGFDGTLERLTSKVGTNPVEYSKEAASRFIYEKQDKQVPDHTVVFIGDGPSEMKVAKKLGAIAIGIVPKHKADQLAEFMRLRDAGADYVIMGGFDNAQAILDYFCNSQAQGLDLKTPRARVTSVGVAVEDIIYTQTADEKLRSTYKLFNGNSVTRASGDSALVEVDPVWISVAMAAIVDTAPDKKFQRISGGLSRTTSSVLASLGIRAKAIVPLGKSDKSGQSIATELESSGVDTTRIAWSAYTSTATNLIRSREKPERRGYYTKDFALDLGACKGFNFKDHLIDDDFDADVFHFGGIELTVQNKEDAQRLAGDVLWALKEAKKHNAVTVLDTVGTTRPQEDFWRYIPDEAYEFIDVLKPGWGEARVIWADVLEVSGIPEENLRARQEYLVKWLISKGVRSVFMTLDSDGCIAAAQKGVFLTQGIVHIPAILTDNFKEGTGCGDAFTAGIIYGVLNKWDFVKTASFASAVGSLVAEQTGGNLGHSKGIMDVNQRLVDARLGKMQLSESLSAVLRLSDLKAEEMPSVSFKNRRAQINFGACNYVNFAYLIDMFGNLEELLKNTDFIASDESFVNEISLRDSFLIFNMVREARSVDEIFSFVVSDTRRIISLADAVNHIEDADYLNELGRFLPGMLGPFNSTLLLSYVNADKRSVFIDLSDGRYAAWAFANDITITTQSFIVNTAA